MYARRTYHKAIKVLTTGLVLAVMLMYSACTKDSTADFEQNMKKVTMMPYARSFFEVNQMSTRSLPTGFVPYDELTPTCTSTSIRVKFANDANAASGEHDIVLVAGEWTSSIFVNDKGYYVYGLMPAHAGSIAFAKAEKSGTYSYANGCTITATGVDAITSEDVSVVVGVKRSNVEKDIRDVDLRLGDFSFVANTEEENRLYLLLEHLYAGLYFRIHVDSEYANLRTIKVKQMELKTVDYVQPTVDITVNLATNDTGTDPVVQPVVYEKTGAAVQASAVLYQSDEGFEVPVGTTNNLIGCFAPGTSNLYDLITTYDIYDKSGNLVRANCLATNRISHTVLGITQEISELKAGEVYTVDLLIKPTYLYVMSDPDLINPTIVIE